MILVDGDNNNFGGPGAYLALRSAVFSCVLTHIHKRQVWLAARRENRQKLGHPEAKCVVQRLSPARWRSFCGVGAVEGAVAVCLEKRPVAAMDAGQALAGTTASV